MKGADAQAKTLTAEDFEKVLGERLSGDVHKLIAEADFRYREAEAEERDQYILEILKRLFDSNLVMAGPHRLGQWEAGWGENLAALRKSEEGALAPKYFGKFEVLRWRQKFIKPLTKNFESKTLQIIQEWLFEKYLPEAKAVYEFGCGTGHHLFNARRVNKSAPLCGLDWAESSQKIIAEMAKRKGDAGVIGHRFDFFHPDYSFKLLPGSAVYTVAALEQTGKDYGSFVEYLLKNKPKICFHTEPIGELLDEKNLLDYLSVRYFEKRNYLSGFLDHLRWLEKEGNIKIHRAQRTYIGSLFIEGYSVVAWSPLP